MRRQCGDVLRGPRGGRPSIRVTLGVEVERSSVVIPVLHSAVL